MHKHYCENDVEALISLLDDRLGWFGTGEEEYATGTETVSAIFRQFAGMVPKCNIADEEYEAIEITPEVWLCTGRLWISTDPSTEVYIRMHQRVATIFRLTQGRLRCCHIHISNPYIEMVEGDVGFPTKVARQTYDYMQRCIEEQKKKIDAQNEELTSIYNTVPCVIIRLLRKGRTYQLLTYNRAVKKLLGRTDEEVLQGDWSEGFCDEVYKEDRPMMRASLDELKKPGDTSELTYRISVPGGFLYYNSMNSLIREDEDGQLIQRIAFDVTEQVKASELLKRKSYEDSLTRLPNRNKFEQDISTGRYEGTGHLGVACLDLNGLKEVNDLQGHRAGDDLICRTAAHINRVFPGRTYRIGGDEFVVLDDMLDEVGFRSEIASACRSMKADGITIAVGCSWRSSDCSIREQFDEADKRMYLDKDQYYRRVGIRKRNG